MHASCTDTKGYLTHPEAKISSRPSAAENQQQLGSKAPIFECEIRVHFSCQWCYATGTSCMCDCFLRVVLCARKLSGGAVLRWYWLTMMRAVTAVHNSAHCSR